MREKVEAMEKAELELKRAMTEERREWIRIKENEFATVKEQLRSVHRLIDFTMNFLFSFFWFEEYSSPRVFHCALYYR